MNVHTKLSDETSVVSVREAFATAEKLGVKAIAFTNLNNVQSFPEIMRVQAEFPDIKVIYGAQIRYRKNDRVFGLTLLAQNEEGIKNLYKIISSVRYSAKFTSETDLNFIKANRNNLLIGSSGVDGELYDVIKNGKAADEVSTLYDYFEVYPTSDDCEREINKKIFSLGEQLGVMVVAAGNCHYIDKTDKLCCDIVDTAREREISNTDAYYLRSENEMLEEFDYLGKAAAQTVVLENPQQIADIIEDVKPLKEGNYYPVFENAYRDLETLCYDKAREIYGDSLPGVVQERLESELAHLKDEKFASQYMLAKKLTDFAIDNNQKFMIRGAAGSAFVAFLLGVSEINPLPPHYRCDCHYFEVSGLADDGFDLPQKVCPVCGKKLKSDGHNIPYEVFMGINGEKMPDIDLNFPCNFFFDIQGYMGELFGNERLAQAGTTAHVLEYMAEKYINEYELVANRNFNVKEREEIIGKITGIKLRDGMHPGGVVVIPENMDFEDFTPLNKHFAPRSTTHFDFHSLHNTILKQDILGHNTLDLLLELEKITGKTTDDVEFNDAKIYDLLSSGDTEGIGEFEKEFVRNLLIKLSPQSFNDLVKISGFCHGTNVWIDNAENLINDGICDLSEAIASRDDIFNYLIAKGTGRADAFKIMESARKGQWSRNTLNDIRRSDFIDKMREVGAPDWYIESIAKMRYMFTKAHAVANVMTAVRLAWFKVYYSKEFETALSKIQDL